MTEHRLMWVQGRLREVKPRWLWLFRLFGVGFDVPDKSMALAEALRASEKYHRKCEEYIKAVELQG